MTNEQEPSKNPLSHPDRARALLLRGIFMCRRSELLFFYQVLVMIMTMAMIIVMVVVMAMMMVTFDHGNDI